MLLLKLVALVGTTSCNTAWSYSLGDFSEGSDSGTGGNDIDAASPSQQYRSDGRWRFYDVEPPKLQDPATSDSPSNSRIRTRQPKCSKSSSSSSSSSSSKSSKGESRGRGIDNLGPTNAMSRPSPQPSHAPSRNNVVHPDVIPSVPASQPFPNIFDTVPPVPALSPTDPFATACDENWETTRSAYQDNLLYNWNSPDCYTFYLKRYCYCPAMSDEPIRVLVRNGTVVEPEDSSMYIPTMEQLFSTIYTECIADCPESGAELCQVEYGPLGNVAYFYYDESFMLLDEEQGFNITNFTLCPA